MILVWKMYKIIEFLHTVSDDNYLHSLGHCGGSAVYRTGPSR